MTDLQQQVDKAVADVLRWDNFSDETITAMRGRCEHQGHELENCCTAFFDCCQRCRWCGSSYEPGASP